MKFIESVILPKQHILPYLNTLYPKTSKNHTQYQIGRALQEIESFLLTVKDEVFVCVESPYVDKLFRNQYYHYYSSKLVDFNRDCIRISFFKETIDLKEFRDISKYERLQSIFLGFLVLRPTLPNVIGRSVLSPFAFKNEKIYCCSTVMESSILGIKLKVEGFPHASQDSEMMVCAETTIWSIMEYFANRYSDYRPALPHKIHSILSTHSNQRQIPSTGLTAIEISYALKKIGFGVRIYAKEAYGIDEFNYIFKSYIESGLPVIVGLENDNIAHVVIYMGRTENTPIVADLKYNKINAQTEIADYYSQCQKYVSIDDNHPPYRIVDYDKPSMHYKQANWADCEITSITVPLYPKIYLESDQAKRLSKVAFNSYIKPLENKKYIFRTYLSSCRSYKHYLALYSNMHELPQDIILNISMSKFIWITEIMTEDDYLLNKASGLIIMDATENSQNGILAFYLENTYFITIDGLTKKLPVPLQPFNIFNNLKAF